MAYAANYRRVGEAVLAIVATGAMFYFGNGLNPLWPLMWIAPLPVLVFALRSKWWATAMLTVASMLLGNLNMWSYLTKTLGMSCAGVAWRSAERTGGATRSVGNERVCPQLDDAAWVCGEPGVLAAALPPVPAACFDHGTVGDELCAAAVSRCDRDRAAS